MPLQLSHQINQIASLARQHRRIVGTAESCTAGLVGKKLTDAPGASDWYGGGVIAYHNDIKSTLLHVPADTLRQHGAVSAETALAMYHGLRRQMPFIDAAVTLTGIAGPGGASAQKPVGTVFFAAGVGDIAEVFVRHFDGAREHIRECAADFAIEQLCAALQKHS